MGGSGEYRVMTLEDGLANSRVKNTLQKPYNLRI